LSAAALSVGAAPVRARRRWVSRNALLCLPALLFLALFFLAPLVLNGAGVLVDGGGASLRGGYVKLLTDPYYLGIVWNTLWVSAVVTLASLILGYPVAYLLARHAGRWAGIMVFLLVAPLLTSTIMRAFGFQVLLARRGVLNVLMMNAGLISRPTALLDQPVAVYIGLVHVLVPFMVLSISSVLQGMDRRLAESARMLGANRVRTFFSITLPLSLDGITTGCILVFMISNGSFVTMLLLGGGRVVTLPVLIYQQFTLTHDVGFASAMGNLLLLLALVCLLLQLRLVRRRGVA
jgi:putative spermidine/putrescine transport system permease protein